MFFFGDRREKVEKIRKKDRKEQLRLNREIKEAARKERRAEFERKRLESKTASARAEERYYETELKKRRAKRALSPLPKITLPSPKLKKKEQGAKLSRRMRIKLL